MAARRNANTQGGASATPSAAQNGHSRRPIPAVVEPVIQADVQAEECVLGSILISPEVLGEVSALLKPHDFWRQTHRMIFRAMTDIAARGETPELLAVLDELDAQGKLEEVGGDAAVTMLPNNVPHSYGGAQYARIVLKHAIRRM